MNISHFSVLNRQTAIDLTRYIMHKHYCENDVEAIIELLDEPIIWFGAGEQEYATQYDTLVDTFRRFSGKVLPCVLTDESYDALEIAPNAYLCAGRVWISTAPSTGTYLKVHQRVTTIFRQVDNKIRCCHIHISNPYTEMMEGEEGFPSHMAAQSQKYFQQCMAEEKKLLDSQNAELASIYDTVPCAIIRLIRQNGSYRLLTCNQALADILGKTRREAESQDWSKGYPKDVDPDDIPLLEDALARLQKPEDSFHVAFRILKENNKPIHLSSKISMISQSPHGQVIQVSAYNVTARVELESMLQRLSFEDSLTGLLNRNGFNRDIDYLRSEKIFQLGVACFDLNELKKTNDHLGHSSGDSLIQGAAAHIRSSFQEKAYRVGGDEFVVINTTMDESSFGRAVNEVCQNMKSSGISISEGVSWRCSNCNIDEQLEEADMSMYKKKKKYYNLQHRTEEKN